MKLTTFVTSKTLRYATVLVVLIFLSCQTDPKSYLEFVNGYWEIEQVTFPNGDEKEYKFNEMIDYIQINDDKKGFRKKVKPNLDQTFSTSNHQEYIEAKIENDSLNLYYKTPFNSWKETVLSANDKQLTIVLKNNVTYTYKRFQPLNLNLSNDE